MPAWLAKPLSTPRSAFPDAQVREILVPRMGPTGDTSPCTSQCLHTEDCRCLLVGVVPSP